MKILAIETSCDETGIAIVEGTNTEKGFAFTTLGAAALNSQAALHAPYGGVFPTLAKREHEKNLPLLFEKFSHEQVDAVAVTQGPGLEPALWTGIEFAKKIARERGAPLLPMNHMEGHLISSLVQHEKLENVQLPVLALLISGGHTEFVLMKQWFEYEVVGETQDDAVGEAFDKVARMLGLPYPGGPEISKLATAHREEKLNLERLHSVTGARTEQFPSKEIAYSENSDFSVQFPRPMLHSKNLDLSFSGLKTAVLYALRDMGGVEHLSHEQKAAFAQEFEDAVGDVLVAKTKHALEQTGAKTFVIGGGVAANSYLRGRLATSVQKEHSDVEVRLPELSITGDNAIMIAQAALTRALSGIDDIAKGEVHAYSNRFSISAPH